MKISKITIGTFLTLVFIGLLDATYLTVQHYIGAIPPCLITEGCGAVLTSKWSSIFGLPVALLGAVYYLTLLILTALYVKNRNGKYMLVAALTTSMGLLAALWFVSLQFFIVKEICFYCMVSATVSTALFIIGLRLLVAFKKAKNEADKLGTENFWFNG